MNYNEEKAHPGAVRRAAARALEGRATPTVTAGQPEKAGPGLPAWAGHPLAVSELAAQYQQKVREHYGGEIPARLR